MHADIDEFVEQQRKHKNGVRRKCVKTCHLFRLFSFIPFILEYHSTTATFRFTSLSFSVYFLSIYVIVWPPRK